MHELCLIKFPISVLACVDRRTTYHDMCGREKVITISSRGLNYFQGTDHIRLYLQGIRPNTKFVLQSSNVLDHLNSFQKKNYKGTNYSALFMIGHNCIEIG